MKKISLSDQIEYTDHRILELDLMIKNPLYETDLEHENKRINMVKSIKRSLERLDEMTKIKLEVVR